MGSSFFQGDLPFFLMSKLKKDKMQRSLCLSYKSCLKPEVWNVEKKQNKPWIVYILYSILLFKYSRNNDNSYNKRRFLSACGYCK